ncbi:hypothetical protein NPIL_270761 [Nephila pilipes]|uniref:Uncharacterized protein n=1 Tax=Nephila pilipes TaxID=299642 RepID=A0A8X6TN36_NEPPI|nr:hypothetical protein NPIL_270761 [Nephila pilipes]
MMRGSEVRPRSSRTDVERVQALVRSDRRMTMIEMIAESLNMSVGSVFYGDNDGGFKRKKKLCALFVPTHSDYVAKEHQVLLPVIAAADRTLTFENHRHRRQSWCLKYDRKLNAKVQVSPGKVDR